MGAARPERNRRPGDAWPAGRATRGWCGWRNRPVAGRACPRGVRPSSCALARCALGGLAHKTSAARAKGRGAEKTGNVRPAV
ncbi:MAG: hypothetical protein DBY17_06075 [Oscillospiraceae bacterium]|nr:MAG: hypothetical protein DBY17_06075 [Oscillospiraceae bacterium]